MRININDSLPYEQIYPRIKLKFIQYQKYNYTEMNEIIINSPLYNIYIYYIFQKKKIAEIISPESYIYPPATIFNSFLSHILT